MFQVATIRLQKQQEQQQHRAVSRQSVTLQVSPQTSVHTSVVMKQGITTMDPPPSMVFIDQNLHGELTKRFPEVPNDVICKLIQQNGNHREDCMMALVRESQKYPVANPLPAMNSSNTTGNMILQSPTSVPETQVTISNGIRNRSDSAGSRGSISSVGTGQSPTALSQYPNINTGVVPPYRHSASDPHGTNVPSQFVTPGPKTAPTQPESFTPFPNMPRAGVDFNQPTLEGPSYDPSYPGQQHGYRQWASSTQQHPGYSAASVHPSWRSPPHGTIGVMNPGATQYTPNPQYPDPPKASNMPSRPGQFDQKFPPSSLDSFSSGSPHKWNSPVGGSTKNVPTSQSPVTTPPRNHHSWEAAATSSPSMYRAPSPSGYPSHRHDQPGYSPATRAEPPSSTYISSISKYIAPQEGSNEPSPYHGSPNINRGQGDPYTMAAISSALSRTTPPGGHTPVKTTYHIPNTMAFTRPGDTPWRTTAVVTPPNLPPDQAALHELQRTPSDERRQSMSDGLVGSEDMAYTVSLLTHQKSRLEKLKQDIRTLYSHRDLLQQRVKEKEQCILRRRREKLGQRPSISVTDLQKVRDENRSLQVDSHLLTLEFDRITKGQAVIGSSDPNENFYKRINHGQTGVPPSSQSSSTVTHSTSVVSHPPTHPPAPPSLVSSHPPPRPLQEVVEEENWSCTACTFANHPELTHCEMCNMPRVGRR